MIYIVMQYEYEYEYRLQWKYFTTQKPAKMHLNQSNSKNHIVMDRDPPPAIIDILCK